MIVILAIFQEEGYHLFERALFTISRRMLSWHVWVERIRDYDSWSRPAEFVGFY
jgi:hypothetical protein